jgi:hypothetical protein
LGGVTDLRCSRALVSPPCETVQAWNALSGLDRTARNLLTWRSAHAAAECRPTAHQAQTASTRSTVADISQGGAATGENSNARLPGNGKPSK